MSCYFKTKEKQVTQATSIFKCSPSGGVCMCWGAGGGLPTCLFFFFFAKDAVFPRRQRVIFEEEVFQMQLQQDTKAQVCTWVNTCFLTEREVQLGRPYYKHDSGPTESQEISKNNTKIRALKRLILVMLRMAVLGCSAPSRLLNPQHSPWH